jgi:predicted GNAT family acetyltransferase
MTGLELIRYDDAGDFLEVAGDYLVAREAEHNLILGISGRLRSAPLLFGSPPYFAAVLKDGKVVGAALRTPPHNLVLSELVHARAVDLLMADVAVEFPDLPGVLGPKEATRRFVELWQQATGSEGRLAMAERAFCCARVVAAPPVSGSLCRATAADRALLVEWMRAFIVEAFAAPPPRPAEETVDDLLGRGGSYGAFLWDDGAAVSFAGCGNPTPNGARVGPVYTPPELRGRGYASALVASLTERLLAGGRRFCFLFTDLSNPTSNKIYQRIGYEPVADVDEYRFERR